MSTKSLAALPAALRDRAGERFVIEAARRVHRALGDTNRLDLVRRLGRQLLGKIQVATRQSLAEGADRAVVERLGEGMRSLSQAVTAKAGGEG